MKIDIINNALPPRFEAIGHYTSIMAREIADAGHDVRILVPQADDYEPIPGIEIVPCFTTDPPRGVEGLVGPIEARAPDWVILQYNPFGYGKRGLNLDLPRVLAGIKKRHPGIGLAVMAHETFVPWRVNVKFAVMASWQVPQFRQLGRAADVLFLSIDPWVAELKPWFPRTPVIHLPVPSNMPNIGASREEARKHLGIASETPVLGLFGAIHISRALPLVQRTVEEARKADPATRMVYIGPNRAEIEAFVGEAGIFTDGPASGEEVSRRFAAMDVTLSTFTDGVSTRRGSFMTSLQHGVAVVGTLGHHTDTILRENTAKGPLLIDVQDEDGFVAAALRLLKDRNECAAVGRHGQELYDAHFAPKPLVEKMFLEMAKVRKAR